MLSQAQKADAVRMWKKAFDDTELYQPERVTDHAIEMMVVDDEYLSIETYMGRIAQGIWDEISLALPNHLHEFMPDQYDIKERMSSNLYRRVVRLAKYIFNLDNSTSYIYSSNMHQDVEAVVFCETEFY